MGVGCPVGGVAYSPFLFFLFLFFVVSRWDEHGVYPHAGRSGTAVLPSTSTIKQIMTPYYCRCVAGRGGMEGRLGTCLGQLA